MKKRLLSIIFIISIILSSTYITGTNLAFTAGAAAYLGNIQGGGFESDSDLSDWTLRNQTDQTISIDTANAHNGSAGALAINMPTDYYGKSTILNFRGKTVDGAEQSFDTEAKYYAEMYIKTSEDFCGSVYLRLRQNSQYIQSNNSPDLLLLGSLNEGVGGSESYIKIKTSAFNLTKHSIQMLLYVNGTGKIWIDDINIKIDKELLNNGGFENGTTGWDSWGSLNSSGKNVSVSNTETCLSGGALVLNNDETIGNSDILYMASSAVMVNNETQYVFSGDVKSVGAGENKVFIRVYQYYTNEGGGTATDWLKCLGSENAVLTGGTTDWQHFSLKLSGLRANINSFVVMVYLEGPGTAYFDNLSVTEREKPYVPAGEVKADVSSGIVEPMTNVSLFAHDGYDIYYTVDGSNPKNSPTAFLYNINYGIYISEATKIKACAVADGVAGEVYEFNYGFSDDEIIVETFDSEESVKKLFQRGHFDNGAMKIDMAQTGNGLFGEGRGGADFTVPVDTALLDANTEYNFSVRFRTEGVEDLGAFLKAQLSVNGTATNYQTKLWTADNFQFFADETGGWTTVATEGIPTEWTEVVCPATFMLAGNTLSLYVNISSVAAKGTLWIDDIKIIPVEKSISGTVKATGKDANGNDIYTATAKDGYKVGTIKAENTTEYGSVRVTETVDEISRTDKEVKFTVNYANDFYLIGRHLTVSFEENGLANGTNSVIKDDTLWSKLQTTSAVSLDTSNKKIGGNSIKIKGGTSKRYASTGDMRIDCNFDYKLEFYVKTQNLANPDKAFVNVFMEGAGSVINELDSRWGAYVKTKNIISGIKATQDWTRYELLIDDLNGFWPTLDITAGILGSTGTLWIDGVKLTALPYEYYPLTVSGDGETFGNAYYKKSLENFTLNQGFYISNNTYNTEIAQLNYKVYKDIDTSTAIDEGKINVSLNKKEQKEYTINLDALNKYGTYTIEFYAENQRGYSYYAGYIRVAIIKDSSGVNDSIFGVNGASTDSFGRYKASGINMLRTDLHWNQCEEEEGVLSIPDTYEKLVNDGLENCIDQMFIIGGGNVPSWYDKEGNNSFPRSDKQIAQFMNFTKMVVEHFKGRVKYYELFNEANDSSAVGADAVTYGKVLKEFYKTVKAADPDAYVVAGATSLWHPNWASEVFRTAGDSMDYWSIHPYANPDSPEDRNWFENLEYMQSIAQKQTGRKIPFLLTELGWSNNESAGGATEAEQLKWYPRIMAFAQSSGYVERVTIYNDYCGGSQNKYVQELRWGMFSTPFAQSGYAKPFVTSLSNYVSMTDGYTFQKRIELLDGLYIFKYTSDKKEKDLYMLWTNDVEYRAKIINSTKNSEAFDIFGNSLKENILDYMSCQNIGGNPIYITLDKGESIKKIQILSENDVIGDANSDGKTNILDFIKVKKHLADKLTTVKTINVDYNGTENVDLEDLISLTKQLLGLFV